MTEYVDWGLFNTSRYKLDVTQLCSMYAGSHLLPSDRTINIYKSITPTCFGY
jgi:hypothetical protein